MKPVESKPAQEIKPIILSKPTPSISQPTQIEPPKKVSSLFAGADDDDEEDDFQPAKPAPAKLPETPMLLETKLAPPV